jgi:pilus assembly protein Flp/PilA
VRRPNPGVLKALDQRETTMKKLMQKLLKNKSGATAIEYALIAGLIGIVIIVGAQQLGNNINQKYKDVATQVKNAGR